jgi:diaminopimelate epimerase
MYNGIMSSIDFIKMHGLGNDFVIIDLRKQKLEISNRAVKSIANRRTGVGCDQLIAIEEPKKSENDVRLRIWNADGGEVGACGNAMRCVGHLILKETNKVEIAIETVSGIIKVNSKKEGKLSVDMGPPRIHWNEIPLATECDTLSLDITINGLKDPVGVSMGNPHVVFFVEDICAVDLDKIGPQIENHPLFPARVNVGIAKILDNNQLRLRVWERGVGITNACGTGACAAVVAGVRRNLISRSVSVNLDGGILEIEWQSSNNRVIMTGPVSKSFQGTLI